MGKKARSKSPFPRVWKTRNHVTHQLTSVKRAIFGGPESQEPMHPPGGVPMFQDRVTPGN